MLASGARGGSPAPGLLKRVVATLTFDGGLRPAVGVRSAGTQGARRQLVYSADDLDVALNILPRARDKNFDLHGQVLTHNDVELGSFSVQLLQGETELAITATDDLGAFALTPYRQACMRLSLAPPDRSFDHARRTERVRRDSGLRPKGRRRFVEELLALPTLEQRSAFLRTAGLLNAEGLESARLRRPVGAQRSGKAHRLAALCADLADLVGAHRRARASYIRGQTYAANGELGAALRMAEAPRRVHSLRQEPGGAAHPRRSDVRAPRVGLYREALDAGQIVLDTLMAGANSRLRPRDSRPICLPRSCIRTAAVATNTWAATKMRSGVRGRRRALPCPRHDRGLGEILDNRGAILTPRPG